MRTKAGRIADSGLFALRSRRNMGFVLHGGTRCRRGQGSRVPDSGKRVNGGAGWPHTQSSSPTRSGNCGHGRPEHIPGQDTLCSGRVAAPPFPRHPGRVKREPGSGNRALRLGRSRTTWVLVIPGRVPGTHEHRRRNERQRRCSWIAGTSRAITAECGGQQSGWDVRMGSGGTLPSPSSSRNSRQRISGIGEPGRPLVFSIDGSVAPRSRLGLTAVRDDEGRGYPDATPAKDIAPRLVPVLHEHNRWR